MKRATFNYLRSLLADYNELEAYIQQREEELRSPWREEDLNSGIKGTRGSYDNGVDMLITIEQDRRLHNLQKNKWIIGEALEDCDEDTRIIIDELYLKKRPAYTMQGLIDNHLIFCSRAKAFRLRDYFFEELAKKFNLEV